MSWFRKKASRPKSSRPNPVGIAKNGWGVACFDFGMRPPEVIPSHLLSSGLAWFWTSSRSGPASEWSKPELPETRTLTRLSEHTAQTFVDDYRDSCRGYDGREIIFAGIKADLPEIDPPEMDLKRASCEFATEGRGPIQVIAYSGDDGDGTMYTAWPLCEPVRNLLSSWLVRSKDISEIIWSEWSAEQTTGLESLTAHILKQSKV